MSETILNNIAFKGELFYNADPDCLIQEALKNEKASLSDTGALCVTTGKYTGRAAKNRFFVSNDHYHNDLNWGKHCLAIDENRFERLYKKVTDYLSARSKLYIFDGRIGKSDTHFLNVRIINELASQNLCVRNMFVRLPGTSLDTFQPDFQVLAAPSVCATPEDGIEGEAFICIHLSKKIVIIGGTGYAGEIKKSLFTVMNFLMPLKGVLPMHCAANRYKGAEEALFFGLSGTGKTTLSTDVNRHLIGDDEHGWDENGIFNFEGGCYAKTYNLNPAFEPQVYSAIKKGAVAENVVLNEKSFIDFADKSITENGRVSYPIEFIEDAELSGKGGHPKTIFFLTADAFGVLPPVSKLNHEMAMYHFISGYTSKLAGTETGVKEPQATFSPFFGGPFMPLKPMVYANLLHDYLIRYHTNVFLINTGWTGGPYGTGKRIRIDITRSIITAALKGDLNDADYEIHPIFNLPFPLFCPNVDKILLNPANTWADKIAYAKQANALAKLFAANISQFKDIPESVLQVGPKPWEVEYKQG